MTDVFDHSSSKWSFVVEASTILMGTQLAQTEGGLGVLYARGPKVQSKHDAAYWDKATAGFDFSDADRVPPDKFNRVLWKGLMGSKPYPALTGVRASVDRDDDDR